MRFLLEFSDDLAATGWPAVHSTRIDELAAELGLYCPVEKVMLPATTELVSLDPPYTPRALDEQAWVVSPTMDGLAEYMSDRWRTVVAIPTSRWHVTADGERVAHMLLISDGCAD